jgi:hypothetical protein
MSAYKPPNFNLPIFDSQAFTDVNTSEFLEFPTAQGLETFPNGLIGNLTGNATSASTITTASSTENVAHYLNFSNSSSTGIGTVQKTAGLSCNPSANSITATNFLGSASKVNLTADDSAGTSYIPFSKTTDTSNNILYIDNTTGPLSYNANTSTLTATNFAGLATTSTNIFGGTAGKIPYQSSANNTAFVDVGSAGQLLSSNATSAPTWISLVNSSILGTNYNNAVATDTLTSADFGFLNLYNVSVTVNMPSTGLTNLAYVKLGLRGNNQTLTVVASGGGTIITLTTSASASGSVGVTLMYHTTTNFTGWFVVN